jgi:hypothetical protein
MSKRALWLTGVIVLAPILAALARLVPHAPNFAPITAMAVFFGIRFGNRLAAIAAPLVALLLSDAVRQVLYAYGLSPEWGFYRGMEVVYGTTALIALMATLARGTRSTAVIAATTFAGSCLFFLVTNFDFWVRGPLYPRTAEGLATCYAAALPFFRNSLISDFGFAAVLFGAWALAEATIPQLAPAPKKA